MLQSKKTRIDQHCRRTFFKTSIGVSYPYIKIAMNIFSDSLPLILFVFAGLFSPGPNVIMLMASGARFGFRATLPHLLGVPIGTGIIAAVSGLGIGALLISLPTLKLGLQLIAVAWILWMAWSLAKAGFSKVDGTKDRPFTFFQAILFQAVNPKIWAVTMAAGAGFSTGLAPASEAVRMFAVFCGINLAVCLCWTLFGHLLARILSQPLVWRGFMLSMAVVLALTSILVFL